MNTVPKQPSIVAVSAMSEPGFEHAKQVLKLRNLELATAPSFRPHVNGTMYPEDELREICAQADVLYMAGTKVSITPAVLAANKNLRGIVTSSIGYNSIDVDACTDAGVLVANSPATTNIDGVVQHTLLLTLALRRNLGAFQQWVREGAPSSPSDHKFTPRLVGSDTIVGIVGFGRVGYRVARAFHELFGAQIIIYDPYVADARADEVRGRLVDSLDELLGLADIVSLHPLLSSETKKLIGPHELDQMKSTSLLINTSRGPVVDESALVEALKVGKISGAGLDVMETEPIAPSNPLLGMDNVIVTPHVAGVSAANSLASSEIAAENAAKLISGEIPRSIVNPEVLDKWHMRFPMP